MAKDELQNEFMEFQNLQQQMQIIAMQKQQMQLQLQETERAKEELSKANEKQQIYRFVGSVFVPKNRESLIKELSEEKDSLELRKSGLLKQESKLSERMQSIRKKLESAQSLAAGEGASSN